MSWKSLLLLAALLLGLASSVAGAEGLHIVAAENFYGGVAAQIANPDATVTSILSNPNQDPHEFTSSASTARAVAEADVVIYNGLGYDTWMEKLLATGGKPKREVICLATLKLAKAGDNPHLWYDPRTMRILAARLTILLSEIDVPHELVYEQRGDAFRTALVPLSKRIAALQAAHAGTPVTATEPVFGYMADLLGFKMLNSDFQIKTMNDVEPSAAETAAFEKSLSDHAVKILFYNGQVSDPATERLRQLAQKSGIPVVGVSETQPPDAKSYVDWMDHQLDAVEAAFGK